MSVNYTDFDKIWASTSPLTPYEFSESQYKEGWNFVGNTPPSRQMWDKFMQQADEKMQYLYNHESVPVGHEYFTFNPNIPQGSLPLFGGEYSRETYSALWNWVQQQTGYLKTEAEWQQLYTTNAGNVPFYSDGDGSTTFRVPSLKCWIKAANGTVSEVGSYLQAGLPNITGAISSRLQNDAWLGYDIDGVTNAFYGGGTSSNTVYGITGGIGRNTRPYQANFDASRSSSIYGNSTTVQPPSIVGMWLVKAYGVVEDTGSIDEQAYIDDRMNAMTQYVDDEVETGVPTGCVQAFAGQTTPTGWLLCDGSAVSRVTYAKLFSVIGTSYGAGDGSTTFNLPDLVDKFVQGNATSGTVKSAGLPNIGGYFSSFSGQALCSLTSMAGPFYARSTGAIYRKATNTGTDTATTVLGFEANRANSIYGNSTTVQPPALTMRYIIKY